MTANSSQPAGPWKVLDALNWTAKFFEKAGALSPRLDAELLLAEALQLERIQLYVQFDRPLTPQERTSFRQMVLRRANGEPVQYILGEQGFWSLDLVVVPGVLIPRPDTEVLVEEALVEAKRILAGPLAVSGESLRIADVGTGSGAIALSLATELEGAHVWASDLHDVPLRTAADNAQRLGLSERVTVLRADLLAGLRDRVEAPFHLVVSNPPYIRPGDLAGLMREVRDWEPHEALVGADQDGLGTIRAIINTAVRGDVICDGGSLLLEIGDQRQADAVGQLMEQTGFTDVRTRSDYASKPRAVVGLWRTQ